MSALFFNEDEAQGIERAVHSLHAGRGAGVSSRDAAAVSPARHMGTASDQGRNGEIEIGQIPARHTFSAAVGATEGPSEVGGSPGLVKRAGGGASFSTIDRAPEQ